MLSGRAHPIRVLFHITGPVRWWGTRGENTDIIGFTSPPFVASRICSCAQAVRQSIQEKGLRNISYQTRFKNGCWRGNVPEIVHLNSLPEVVLAETGRSVVPRYLDSVCELACSVESNMKCRVRAWNPYSISSFVCLYVPVIRIS